MAYIYPGGLTAGSFDSGQTNEGWSPESYIYGSRITVPSSGVVSSLGLFGFVRDAVSTAFKLGLYTAGGSLVAQSTVGAITSATATWYDTGAISASVTAGDYFVLVSASTNKGSYRYNSSGAGSYATEAYATAMQATESITAEGDAGLLYGVRLDFTAGGGAASRVPTNFMRQLMSLLQM